MPSIGRRMFFLWAGGLVVSLGLLSVFRARGSNGPSAFIDAHINRDGAISWNDKPLADAGAFEAEVETASKLQPRSVIRIWPKPDAKYEDVSRVLKSFQSPLLSGQNANRFNWLVICEVSGL